MAAKIEGLARRASREPRGSIQADRPGSRPRRQTHGMQRQRSRLVIPTKCKGKRSYGPEDVRAGPRRNLLLSTSCDQGYRATIVGQRGVPRVRTVIVEPSSSIPSINPVNSSHSLRRYLMLGSASKTPRLNRAKPADTPSGASEWEKWDDEDHRALDEAEPGGHRPGFSHTLRLSDLGTGTGPYLAHGPVPAHAPQYIYPSPPFPLPNEMRSLTVEPAAGPAVVLPAPVPPGGVVPVGP